MAYFTRVFCSATRKPKIKEIFEKLKSNGFDVSVDLSESELNTENWTHFELNYELEKLPLLLELNERGHSEEILEEEIDEFLSVIGKPKFYQKNRRKIISYLKNTNYIICIQLPTSDINDDGYNLNAVLMEYVCSSFSGLIQADGEGFYFDNNLVLNLE
jgi:hypothetical protein